VAFNVRKGLYLCNKIGGMYLFRTIILSVNITTTHLACTEVIRYTGN
jgi:hypothetical protein